MNVPTDVAVAGYIVQSTYRLFRADGTQVPTPDVALSLPQSVYWTQYPSRATGAIEATVNHVKGQNTIPIKSDG